MHRRSLVCCRIFLTSLSIILLVFCSQVLQAAEGDLDPTFDGDGKVITDFGSAETAYAVDIQPDGKIVAAGYDFFDCILARYNTDGSLDTSFDGDGKVSTNFGGNDHCHAVKVQSDGKIVMAGTNFQDFVLARYNPDGSLDLSFDGDGIVTIDFGGTFDFAKGLAIQTDGKIVVGGAADIGGTVYDFAMARLNADGSLDNTFDGDGTVTTDFGFDDTVSAVAIQSDNKIVAAGSTVANASTSQFAVARYNPDGSLDSSFDGDGRVTIAFSSGLETCESVVVQADGKIVLAGLAEINVSDFAMARLNANGTLDSSFDGDGKVTTDFAGVGDGVKEVKLQQDGKILAAGTAVIGGFDSDFAVARYNIDGSLDNSFGVNGKVTTDVGGSDDTGEAIALQADGKIIVAGFVNMADFAIARYQTTDCIYCDNFEDNVLDPNWNYIKPSWSEINGSLLGIPAKRTAIAVADPVFAGCQICSVEASVNSAGGLSNKIRMLGWYVDNKNMMQLQIKEETDKIVLKQIVGGSVVSKNKARIPIDPNIFYSINVAFDGTKFNVSVNGISLFSLIPATSVLPGTIGFKVKNTTARFDYIAVR
jgi:uncharacterized delta-60 repeat protein